MLLLRWAAAGAAAVGLTAGAVARQAERPSDPAALFSASCSSCHDADDLRAPSRDALRGRSPQAIVDALTSGSMRYQGLSLNGAERRAVAEYLTGRRLRGSVTGALSGRCAALPGPKDPAYVPSPNPAYVPSPKNPAYVPRVGPASPANVGRVRLDPPLWN